MDIEGGRILIATVKELLVIEGGKKVGSLGINFEPSSLSFNPVQNHVAVGSLSDNKVHVYSLEGTTFTLKESLSHLGGVTDVAYSPDGEYLVASDSNRKVILYQVSNYQLASNKEWGYHNARVNCLAWSPNSKLVASGSLDTTIIIWSVDQPAKHLVLKNAHPQSQITGMAWIDQSQLVSTGQDANTKLWEITGFPPA